MRVEGTGRLVKQAILLIVITLLFLISIQGLPGEHSIQTDKLQYTIGETVYVTVIDANINQQNLYYEYEGFSQRYMGDYTSFSFAPVGIGTHNLVLRDKGGNEITRASFEVIAGEEQKPTEEQPVEQPPTEQPQEPTLPEMPVVPQSSQGITPELKPIKQAFKQQENPEFNLSYEPKQKIIFPEKLKQKGTWQTARETIKAEVFDSSGNKQDILPDIERIEDGKFKITIPSQRAFRPGKYSLKTELTTGGYLC
jgi:hypothetical protein